MEHQQFQQKYQKLHPPYQEKFQAAQKAFFDDTIAVFECSPELVRYRQVAMCHTNEQKLGVDYDYWQYLYCGDIKEYRYNDLVTILKVCEQITLKDWLSVMPYPKELANKMIVDWAEFRRYIEALSVQINPVIDKHTTDLLDKLLRTQHLDVSGQAKTIPLTHGHNPLLNKR